MPALLLVVPGRAQQLAVPADMREDAEACRAAPQVVPDLRLGRVRARPVRIEREGERVKVRRNITGAARIGVVAPRSADVRSLLQHNKVMISMLFETDGHT